ncbi:hypothetical protein QM716_01145 [Rhodococcus sp. IEGM 1409]|uniref:hypothetical protein n=1 Tax=Rhodococcus sp. IEGM 1409 TaxID=3047082 RepID=UPI0024B6F64C|nr:hypothetical protein [Rhodococcus sp. IEGM 1409]MDI9898453.1 hypothetical protein [Rhodococcus sp. IEGM 1409]
MTNTSEDCARLLRPIVDPLHEALAAAYETIRKLTYAPANSPGWYRTASFKRALADHLPEHLASFTFDSELAKSCPRIVLTDKDSQLQLSLRRSTGLGKAMASQVPSAPPGLFQISQLKLQPSKFERAALAWDWPKLDEHGELSDPWPLTFLKAKPGRSLDDGEWEFGLPLIQGATLAEHINPFNPIDEPLLFIDREDDNEDGKGTSAQ